MEGGGGGRRREMKMLGCKVMAPARIRCAKPNCRLVLAATLFRGTDSVASREMVKKGKTSLLPPLLSCTNHNGRYSLHRELV